MLFAKIGIMGYTLFAMIKQSNTTALQIVIETGNTMLAPLVKRMVWWKAKHES